MASALGVAATNYSSEDVRELIKQLETQSKTTLQVPTQTSQSAISSPKQDVKATTPNTRLTRMVKQVREVLPQVPSAVISRDLSKSRVIFLRCSVETFCLLPPFLPTF